MRRRFIALAAAGAYAQALFVPPAASAANAVIPNLSGLWGRQSLDLEQPLTGPGPVVNKRYRPNGTRDSAVRVGDYSNPILTAFAVGVVKQAGQRSLRGEVFANPLNQCQPQPTPFVLQQLEMEVLQRKNEITILYMIDHQVRHILLNRGHPAHVTPTWSGDSVGHYEGDELVIDTIGLKVGKLSMVDAYGTPFTRTLHVVERYRLISNDTARKAERAAEKANGGAMGRFADFTSKGNGLQISVTIEDPGAFTTPWSGLVTYLPGREWLEYVCAESPFDYVTGRSPDFPAADRPDF
jgi:hypothetical protein